MYEKFTDRARKCMQLANQEAQRLNHDHIDAEHILIGIVKEGSGIAAQVLKNLGVECNAVMKRVRDLLVSGPDSVTLGKLPLTPHAKRVIERAIVAAVELGHNYIGTEYLLLGLLREPEGVAAQVLTQQGVTIEKVTAEIQQIVQPPASLPRPGDPYPSPQCFHWTMIAFSSAKTLTDDQLRRMQAILNEKQKQTEPEKPAKPNNMIRVAPRLPAGTMMVLRDGNWRPAEPGETPDGELAEDIRLSEPAEPAPQLEDTVMSAAAIWCREVAKRISKKIENDILGPEPEKPVESHQPPESWRDKPPLL